jgi:hypothetical protein
MSQPNQRQQQIEQLLNKALLAEKFFESESGRLWTELITMEINAAVKDITSDKYDKDHNGYLARKAEMKASQKILRKMQRLSHPDYKQRLKDELEEENT